MSLNARILIIDDEPLFRLTTRRALEDEGYEVGEASNRSEAEAHLQQPDRWDILLLDQRLHGSGGGDIGLELVRELLSLSPESRILIATGYADNAAIVRAFEAGVYDYLEKNDFFETFLKIKVRQALEAPRVARVMSMGEAEREREIVDTWTVVLTEMDPNKKGSLLESLLELIFLSIPGLQEVHRNLRNRQEEIDLLIRNRSKDPFWSKESRLILVECKHWSIPVGKNEYEAFLAKLKNRYGRCKLGIFVSMGGFASTFQIEQLTNRKEKVLIIPLGREDIEQLVQSGDRLSLLSKFYSRSIMAGAGH